MASVAADFLGAARAGLELLRRPEVAVGWEGPSALAGFSVGGLAAHLAYQVVAVREAVGGARPQEPTITLLEHYAQVEWVGAEFDADINVRIRENGEAAAGVGPEVVAARVEDALLELQELRVPGDRAVRLPFWGPWSLRLDDLLVTRMMEIAVHSDDLAVSVGLEAPGLPQGAVDAVIDLLTRLAVRRHGAIGVLRALSRDERAPRSIAAF